MLSYDLAAWGGPLTPGGPDVTSVLPSGLVSDVLGAVDALGPSPGGPSLCHGDLHPGNLLWNGTNWVAIDPRAVIGDPCCDAGRVAVSTALWAGWDLEAALSTICSFSGGDPERTTAWSRAYLLQVLFYYWHFGDVDGPEARRRVERMLF
jgi:streptomycin 6-kinase